MERPPSTMGVTAETVNGIETIAPATATRRIHPQMASPVADRAGLRCSTVSVKAAIHGTHTAPMHMPRSASRIAMEVKVWEEPAFDRNTISTTTVARAPTRMSGLRVRSLSDSTPKPSMATAVVAHVQFNREFDSLGVKLRSVWKYTGRPPTAV